MPRQKGLLKIEGAFDDFVFYRTKYGSMVRRKGNVDRERVATDPKFARSRESSKEFGYASRLGKLIRNGIKECVPGAERGTTNNRLNKRLTALVKEDNIHPRGQRVLIAEAAPRLASFDWREDMTVVSMLSGVPEVAIDIENGKVRMHRESFRPIEYIRMGEWASHVVLILAVVRVDYEGNSYVSAKAVSELIPVRGLDAVDVELECALPNGAGNLIVAGVGVQAYMEVSRRMERSEEGVGFVIVKSEERGVTSA